MGGRWDAHNTASLSFLTLALILSAAFSVALSVMTYDTALKLGGIVAVASLFALLIAIVGLFRRKGNVVCAIIVVVLSLLIFASTVLLKPL